MMIKECEWCGKKFSTRKKVQRFCCRKHQLKGYKNTPKAKKYDKKRMKFRRGTPEYKAWQKEYNQKYKIKWRKTQKYLDYLEKRRTIEKRRYWNPEYRKKRYQKYGRYSVKYIALWEACKIINNLKKEVRNAA